MFPHRGSGLLAAVLAILASAASVHAAEVDRCLPQDSEIVVCINVRQVLDSPLMKKYGLAPAQDALRELSEVEDILKDLGFDPFRDLDRIIVGSPTGADKDRGLVIAHGRFDLEKFKARGDEAARNNPESLRILEVPNGKGGKERVYEVTAPQLDAPLFVAIPTTGTLLVSPGKDYVVDALRKLNATDKPVLKNRAFQSLLEKMDERQSLSLAAVSSAVKKGMRGRLPQGPQQVLDQLQAIGGGVSLGEDVKLEVVLTARSVNQTRELYETARQFSTLAKTFLAALGGGENRSPALELAEQLVTSLRVSRKGTAVIIKGRIDSDVLEDTFKKSK